MQEKGLGEKTGEDPGAIRELQMVVPPANHMMKFIMRVDEVLESRTMNMVGSWKHGAAITVALIEPMPLPDILNKLREMPEVVEIEEKIPTEEYLLGLLEKAAALPKGNPGPQKTIMVTAKQGHESKERK